MVFAALLVGCDQDHVLSLREWSLSVDGPERDLPTQEVLLPARFDHRLPREDLTYHLRRELVLPAALTGRPLQLTLPAADGRTTLLVDGVRVPELTPSWFDHYRRRGPLAWEIPAEHTGDGHLALDLVVEHRWSHSAWMGVAPRVSEAGTTDWGYVLAEVASLPVNVAAAVMLLLVGVTWWRVYLADRSRKAYFWFAIESITVSGYPLFGLGITQAVFGRYDVPVVLLMLSVAITSAIEFTRSYFGLQGTTRWWWLIGVGGAMGSLLLPSPHTGNLMVAPLLVVYLVVALVYMVAISARETLRRPGDRRPLYILVSWVGLAILGAPEFTYWLGWGELAGGVRTGGLGIALIAFWVSMVLGNEHIASLQQSEHLNTQLLSRVGELERQGHQITQLNTELRRQIADRSAQMYAALALTVTGKGHTPTLVPGDIVQQRYRVGQVLGTGGMGTVYEVTRLSDGRRLALKVAREIHGEALARLAREAHMAATAQHPNLVAVVDVDVATAGYLYLVMELVEGDSLRDHKERFGDCGWAKRVLGQLAEGLAALHAAGVVHRDLKPSNVLITRGPDDSLELKIADFGIALIAESSLLAGPAAGATAPDPDPPPPEPQRGETPTLVDRPVSGGPPSNRPVLPSIGDTAMTSSCEVESHPKGTPTPHSDGLTRTGMLPGTPAYIAPELAGGRGRLSTAADVFAFGVIAYELLTGQQPFARPPVLARLEGRRPEAAPPLRAACPDASEALATAIEACLHDDPGHRPTATQLATLLRPDA